MKRRQKPTSIFADSDTFCAMSDGLPPIHDFVRFWQRSEAATLAACVQFRRTPLPGWTLAWLRDAAPIIMTRELSEIALRHAVREKIFPEAQPSVLKAIELFWKFVEKHQWKGIALSESAYRLPNGLSVKVNPIGRYFSRHTKSEWLVALQPRQGNIPNDEQFGMWRSVLVHEFCAGEDLAMIVDLSKNLVNQKRELRELTAKKFPLITKDELDERLEQVGACYRKAIDIVPERPRRPSRDDTQPSLGF
jgi:hypothetical protein